MVALLAPAVARADGDPASDVLLGENVFYPYTPPTSPAIQKQLNAATAAAKRAHFPVKVALIGGPVDLGVIPSLFGKPQKYADFLDQEISFATKQPLLVVMAAGYGVEGMNAKAGRPPRRSPSRPAPRATSSRRRRSPLSPSSPRPPDTRSRVRRRSDGGGGGSSRSSRGGLAIAAAASLVFVRRRFEVHATAASGLAAQRR